jgi:hypothetical protein
VDLLPKPDSVWSIEDRAKWLRLAAGIFDLGYKSVDGEYDDISIVPVKQVAAKPRQWCLGGWMARFPRQCSIWNESISAEPVPKAVGTEMR